MKYEKKKYLDKSFPSFQDAEGNEFAVSSTRMSSEKCNLRKSSKLITTK